MIPAVQTATDDTPPTTRSRVGYLVYRLERRLRDRLGEAVRANGVTTTEYVTLSVLRLHHGMSSAELARWAFVSPEARNVVIDGLGKQRLVPRRPDPRHGRVLRSSMSRKGFEVLDRCDKAIDVIESDMPGQMPSESVNLLTPSLTEMRALAQRQKSRAQSRPCGVAQVSKP